MRCDKNTPRRFCLPVQEHFDAKANDYYQHVYLSGKRNCHVHNQQVRRTYFRALLPNQPARATGRALDIGCGPGSITKDLSENGWDTHCVDISLNMLRNARLITGDSVQHIQCSVESLCFRENAFDLVTAAGVLEYVPNDANSLKEIFRVLKPGGTLVISVPIKSVISTTLKQRMTLGKKVDRFHHKSYTPNTFLNAIRDTGFTLRKIISHHFVLFPIDFLFPQLSIALDLRLTRLMNMHSFFRRFGRTLIVCATKPDFAKTDSL